MPGILHIRQQPKFGRRIGFSDTPTFIYPELVLQLDATIDINEYCGTFVCHVTLIDQQHQESSTVLRPPRVNRPTNNNDYVTNIVGTRTQMGQVCKDPVDGIPKIFFMFHDLGIRTLGTFRLSCQVVDMSTLQTTKQVTETIHIANPKDCPGVSAPSTLVKSLSIQGMAKSGRRYKDLVR